MKSRRPVNSDVMQLIVINKTLVGLGCVLVAGLVFIVACHKGSSAPIRVSLCELYEHPTAYEGKLIRVAGTVTGLPDGTYIYPGTAPRDCDYSFIKLDAANIQNSSLAELKPPTASFPERKEFDLELTGTFDSKYSGSWEYFRYRIVAVEIKPASPVRIGKRMGAA